MIRVTQTFTCDHPPVPGGRLPVVVKTMGHSVLLEDRVCFCTGNRQVSGCLSICQCQLCLSFFLRLLTLILTALNDLLGDLLLFNRLGEHLTESEVGQRYIMNDDVVSSESTF